MLRNKPQLVLFCKIFSTFIIITYQQNKEDNLKKDDPSLRYAIYDYESIDDTQVEINNENFRGIDIESEAKKLGIVLQQLYKEEIGVDAMQVSFSKVM